MPTRPPHPCNWPRCHELTHERYCSTHAAETRRADDDRRGNATSRLYDSHWRRAAKAFLREHPLCTCEECSRERRVTPADTVDHDPPHRGDPVRFWDRSTWRAMAHGHHSRKTALEDGGFGRTPRGGA